MDNRISPPATLAFFHSNHRKRMEVRRDWDRTDLRRHLGTVESETFSDRLAGARRFSLRPLQISGSSLQS
jgi:hypothetical protein